MSETNYPVSFRFEVRIAETALAARTAADASFAEVSGLSAETSGSEENSFVHRLPAAPTHTNLVLKRGVMKADSVLAAWTRETLEGRLSADIKTRTVVVTLVSLASLEAPPIASWTCLDAYPVTMSVDEFTSNSKDDEIVVETMEFAYRSVELE